MTHLRVRRVAIALLLALTAAVACCAAGQAKPAPAPIQYGEGRQLATLANPAIRESSGLACSRLLPDVFWTHNDSGDAPRLYAFNLKGEDLGTYKITGAKAVDWEDIASFQKDGRSFLLIGDIGDNASQRKIYTLYMVPEPRLDPRKRGAAGRTEPAHPIDFRYEDGPHNCEAVAIDPTTMTVYLVVKVLGFEAKVYALPLRGSLRGSTLVARAIGTLRLSVASAMDISPDGLRAIVLTYGDAYEYVRCSDETWAQAFARPGRALRMPPRAQGESICYGSDGKTLYLTSERVPTPLLQVPVAVEE